LAQRLRRRARDTMPEANGTVRPVALAVRAAVSHRGRQLPEKAEVDSTTVQTEDAGETAHRACSCRPMRARDGSRSAIRASTAYLAPRGCAPTAAPSSSTQAWASSGPLAFVTPTTSCAARPRRRRSDEATIAFARQVGRGHTPRAATSTSEATRVAPRGLSSAAPRNGRGIAAMRARTRRRPTRRRPPPPSGRSNSEQMRTAQSTRESVTMQRSARPGHALRGRRGDTRQPFRAQIADELEQIMLEHRGRCIVLRAKRREYGAEGSVILDEPPDARADSVEPEIHAGLEIEDDDLTVELAERDVRIDRHHRG